jgi:Arc/MetJ-type ribon-helix-helix transcriptional regulator
MNITLSPELEERVRELVDRGDYPSADAVVGQAVSLFFEDEGEGEMREIRNRIQTADEEMDHGEYLELDEAGVAALAKDMHERGLRRLDQRRRSGPQ